MTSERGADPAPGCGFLIFAAIILYCVGYFVFYPAVQSAKVASREEMTLLGIFDKVCKDRDVCSKFKAARDECAVASDFRGCLNIKMDNDSYLHCRSDGGSEMLDKINANAMFCGLYRSTKWWGF